jgi:hypothetical protein
LYLLIFSVSLMLKFESFLMAISISRQVFSFLSCSTIPGRFASIFRSVINGIFHLIMVLFSFMTSSGIIIIIIIIIIICYCVYASYSQVYMK